MENWEDNSHTFVLKIWLEDTDILRSGSVWRGHLTHVPDGFRCYVKSMNELIDCLRPFVEQLGDNRNAPVSTSSLSSNGDGDQGGKEED